MSDESPALAAHAAFPAGRVYRLLTDDPEQIEVDLSPRERKRIYNAARAAEVRAYAEERGITQTVAKLELRRMKREQKA